MCSAGTYLYATAKTAKEKKMMGIHVDAASGGFVAPFQTYLPPWDFRLKNVLSISTSGHKFGQSVPAPYPLPALPYHAHDPAAPFVPLVRCHRAIPPPIKTPTTPTTPTTPARCVALDESCGGSVRASASTWPSRSHI